MSEQTTAPTENAAATWKADAEIKITGREFEFIANLVTTLHDFPLANLSYKDLKSVVEPCLISCQQILKRMQVEGVATSGPAVTEGLPVEVAEPEVPQGDAKAPAPEMTVSKPEPTPESQL